MVDYEILDNVLRINALNWAIEPSIENSDACMGIVIDLLTKVKNVERIVIAETREREYDFDQVKLLKEIADAYQKIIDEKIVSISNLGPQQCEQLFPKRLADLQFLTTEVLRKDPIGAYGRLQQMIVHENLQADRTKDLRAKQCYTEYLENVLIPIERILLTCSLIQEARPHISSIKPGDRDIYREIFHPMIRPNFMLTRYMAAPPKNGQSLAKYYLDGNTLVEIFKIPGKVRYVYHVIPPEFRLSEQKYAILDSARQYLAAHRPTETEFTEPDKAREFFVGISRDLIKDLCRTSGIDISDKEINELAEILARYTAGFGVLEILLADDKIQDVFINSPIGLTPIFVSQADFEECETNLIPTKEDAEAWATRFRLYSGRPLDEANPVLDAELNVPGGRARVAAITRTLSPEGLAYAFRRHRDKPWTFPLYVSVNFFNPLYAGLMSFIIDGGRAILIAGGRSSGKTSLLGSMLLEIMKKFRIVSVEDTLELPVIALRNLGYNIERMKSRSVITRIEAELPADEALRTAIRFGDSCLILGEVRSVEALALFEAMRIGALANVVAGTIHAESAYGVYDRVVNDLRVPPTSFKAIDVISICNLLKTPDGLRRFRRVTELTEVRKQWKEDPAEEGGFVSLMEYSAKDDTLKPTDTLIDGESVVLNDIAKRVREWRGDWDAVWDNILLRAKIKETIVDLSKKLKRPEILEADWTTESNEMFHIVSEQVKEEVGGLDSKMIYDRWLRWFEDKLRARR